MPSVRRDPMAALAAPASATAHSCAGERKAFGNQGAD